MVENKIQTGPAHADDITKVGFTKKIFVVFAVIAIIAAKIFQFSFELQLSHWLFDTLGRYARSGVAYVGWNGIIIGSALLLALIILAYRLRPDLQRLNDTSDRQTTHPSDDLQGWAMFQQKVDDYLERHIWIGWLVGFLFYAYFFHVLGF